MHSANFIINTKKETILNIDKSIQSVLNDFDSAYNYHSKLSEYKSAPLISLSKLAHKLGIGGIWVKNEAMRFGVPAIKLLGASYAMHQLLLSNPEIEFFCTATDGNHGRAVAWAARRLNKKAVVFVPDYTVKTRISNINSEGAEVITIPGDYDTTVREAERYANENHAQLIQDTAWKNYQMIPALITAGYYTQMKEIEQQINEFSLTFDLIFVQAGVGSWPSAVAHFASNHPDLNNVKIICVEPFESDCMMESAKRNQLSTTKKSQHTIMAGLNCGTPSLLAWELLRNETNVFLTVDDNYTVDAMKTFYFPVGGDKRIEAGESGAAGLAGLLALMKASRLGSLREQLNINRETRVLIFNTEGITDPVFFHKNILQ